MIDNHEPKDLHHDLFDVCVFALLIGLGAVAYIWRADIVAWIARG